MKLADVSPAILAQQEPEERYWFCWDRATDRPWASVRTGLIRACMFESDAAFWCGKWNGCVTATGRVLDAYPRDATLQEAMDARPGPVGLFDRDGNFIRRLA